MPFYDEHLSTIMGADGTPATHLSLNTKWCAFDDMEYSRRLKTLTSAFWKWGASEDVPFAFEWNQAAGMALLIAGTSASAWGAQFNSTVCSLAAVERVWAKLLSMADAKAYNTEGDLANHLRVAYEKLPREEQDSLAFRGEEFLERIPPGEWPPALRFRNLSEDWEDAIKFGLLAEHSHKLAGLLQRFVFPGHQACFCECKLFHDVLKYLIDQGLVDANLVETAEAELDDDEAQPQIEEKARACSKVARALADALARVANLPESLMASPTDEEHASELMIELLKGADQIFDGSSPFMIKRVAQNVAATAPTLYELLKGTTDEVTYRGYVVELAAAYPHDQVKSDPKTLLALSGLRALERRIANFSAFISSATTKSMHVGERVAQVIERIQQMDRQTSAVRRSARRAQTATQPTPPPTYPPAFSAVINPAHARAGGRGVP